MEPLTHRTARGVALSASSPNDSTSILTPAQMAQAAEDAAFTKATGRPLKSFLLGLTAGGCIALGFVFFVTSQVGAESLPWGVARVLGGVVFDTGLVLVVLTGAEVFTSSTLTLRARASRRIICGQLLRNWLVVYVANFLGAMTMVALVYIGGLGAPPQQAIRGAVVPDVSLHKVLAVTMPIALFVATGFEDSVAKMFMIPLGILVAGTAAAGFRTGTDRDGPGPGLNQAAFGDLTWTNSLLDNLLPVTLGNIVCGGVMIGVLYRTVFRGLSVPTIRSGRPR